MGKLLGEGAFSRVYSAELTEGGGVSNGDEETEWVLKLAKVPPPAKNPKRKSKKQKEAEASSKLLFWEYQVYRNFLRDLDCIPRRPKGKCLYGEENSWRYLALEKLGTTLRSKVDNAGPGSLPIAECFDIVVQIVKGLEKIHKVGIVFRDIKPENFMFGSSPQTKSRLYFVDFGACCKFILHSGKHLDTGNAPAGTPLYMSIFTHELEPPSRRDDLVSVGYMLLWMLAGALPWAEATSDEAVLASKKQFTHRQLCSDLPEEARQPVQNFLETCSSLGVHDKPDYDKLIGYLNVKVPDQAQRVARKAKPKTKASSRAPAKSSTTLSNAPSSTEPRNVGRVRKKRKQVAPEENEKPRDNIQVEQDCPAVCVCDSYIEVQV